MEIPAQEMVAPIEAILDRGLAGGTLSAEDGYRLLNCLDSEVDALIRVAGTLRDQFKGRTVTYSLKIFLPVTNLCRDRCSYCTFRKDPNDPDAWTMTPEEIDHALRLGSAQGCKEALMCLGDKPELAFPQYRETLDEFGHRTTAEYVGRACTIAAEHGFLPHTNAGILSYEEMEQLKPVNASLGLMVENVSPRLSQRGMPHFSAPDKDPAVRLRMLREAGELSIAFTTGILIGIGETRDEVVDSLIAIREIHATYGHIQEVIIQNFRAKPDTRMAGAPEPEAVEMARTVATARLLLGGNMNIQAVDTNYQGRGLGSGLLIDAGKRALTAADVIGARAIVVQAFDEAAKKFYEPFGFLPFSDREPLMLILRISELRIALQS